MACLPCTQKEHDISLRKDDRKSSSAYHTVVDKMSQHLRILLDDDTISDMHVIHI